MMLMLIGLSCSEDAEEKKKNKSVYTKELYRKR